MAESTENVSATSKIELVKYRDWGMPTYTYFWIEAGTGQVCSPYFDTENEAFCWLETRNNVSNK